MEAEALAMGPEAVGMAMLAVVLPAAYEGTMVGCVAEMVLVLFAAV